MKKTLSKICDILGQILAVVLVVVFVLLIIDANFPFISKSVVAHNIMYGILHYGTLLLIAVVGLEAMFKRNIVFLIIFLLMLALIIIFLFFPGTYENLFNLIKKA